MTPDSPSLEPILCRCASWLSLGWIAVIVLLCLVPTGLESPPVIQLCLICQDRGAADFILNVGLYLPLGLFLGLRTGSLTLALVGGFSLSVGIEVAQFWIPGRFTSLSDLIANSSGAALGGLLARSYPTWVIPEPPLARRLSLVFALLATLIVLATGWLFTTSVSRGPLYGNWAPGISITAPYNGSVLSASVAGIPVPSRRLEDSEEVRIGLEDGRALALRFELDVPPDAPAPVFRILDDSADETVRVSVHGSDLLVRVRYLADDFRLARPILRVEGALAPFRLRDTVAIVLDRPAGAGHRIAVGYGDAVPFEFSAGRGWSLLISSTGLSQPILTWLDALWIGLLLVPVGWWAPTGFRALWGFVLPAAALASVPVLTPLSETPLLQFLVALAGLAAGFGARSVTATKWGDTTTR